MFKINSAFVILFFTMSSALSQVNNDPNSLIPPSPTASQLMRFVEVPVGTYTGLPNINLPITNLNQGDLSLPISLSYHAGSNRVETTAAPTGLGWSLIAGGSISRVVRGLPDDDPNGFLNFIRRPGIDYTTMMGDKTPIWAHLLEIAERCADSEPDLYYINVNGIKGMFSFDWSGELVIDKESEFEVVPVYENNDDTKQILGWEIKDGFGNRYYLNGLDRIDIANYSISCTVRQNFVSSWYLTRIEDHNGLNWINLNYNEYPVIESFKPSMSIVHRDPNNSSYGCGGPVDGQLNTSFVTIAYSGQILDEIVTSDGRKVDIVKETQRLDLTDINQPSVNSIDKIKLIDNADQVYQIFELGYDYSTNHLTLVSFKKCGTSECEEPYAFDYSNLELPDKDSYAQDHWGFYNGKNSNTSLVPGAYINSNMYSGANRDPSETHSKAGLLKEMIYPTKGKTVFEYENHGYSRTQSEDVYEPDNRYYSIVASGTCTGFCPGIDWVESEDFDVITFVDPVLVTVNSSIITYDDGGGYFGGGNSPKVEIVPVNNPSNPVYQFTAINSSETAVFVLAPGTYRLRAYAFWKSSINSTFDQASISINYDNETTTITSEKACGGSRIKRITNYDENDENVGVRRFEYLDEYDISTGVIYMEPEYVFYDHHYENLGQTEATCYDFIRLSSNKSQLGTTQGSHIGYSMVTTYFGENGENGKKVDYYDTPREAPDVIYNDPPFPPNESKAFNTGLLKRELIYTAENDLIKEAVNQYSDKQYTIPSFKVSFRGGVAGSAFISKLNRKGYTLRLGHTKINLSEDKRYHEGSEISNINSYEYNNNLTKPIKVEQSTSTGDWKVQQFRYADDYGVEYSSFLTYMKTNGITAIPIETLIGSRTDGFASISYSDATYNTFIEENGSFFFKKIQKLTIPTPRILIHNTQKDPAYTKLELEIITRTTTGKIESYSQNDGIVKTHYWSPDDSQIVLHAINATRDELYYQGFEFTDGTPFSISKIGTNLHVGNQYTIPINNRPVSQEDLILSYWYYSNSEWNQVITNYDPQNPTISASGAQYLDDIIVYPEDAQISTYTYKNGMYITSNTDSNGETVYYSYDNLGRLTSTEDNQGNIRSNIIYNQMK